MAQRKKAAMGDPVPESMSVVVTTAKAQAKARRAGRNAELSTTLQLTCQVTGKPFAHDVRSDAGTLSDLWPRRLMLSCPHCGQVHGFQFRTVYVQAVVAGPRLPFEQISPVQV